MHHTYFVLSQKEPLAKLWLAALWDKKLSKSNIFETDIDSSVDAILKLEMKMALRTSGHLLLGIVKIYSRKANYLLSDCNEAFVKIRLAFRPGVLETTEKQLSAPSAELSSFLVDARETGDVQLVFTVNQSRPEDITLREDVTLALVDSEIFDDFGGPLNQDHLERWLLCGGSDRYSLSDASAEKKNMNSGSVSVTTTDMDIAALSAACSAHSPSHVSHSPPRSVYCPHDATMQESPTRPSLASDIVVDSPPRTMDALPDTMHSTPYSKNSPLVQHVSSPAIDSLADITLSPSHIMHSSDILQLTNDSGIGDSLPCSPEKAVATGDVLNTQSCVLPSSAREVGSFVRSLSFDETSSASHHLNSMELTATDWPVSDPLADDTFRLNPVLQIKQGQDSVVRRLRKRKLVIDEKTSMEMGRMREQLVDTSHTVATMEMAPPTKRFMSWLEHGSAAALLSSLCRTQHSLQLTSLSAAVRRAMECSKSVVRSTHAVNSKTVQAHSNSSEAPSSGQQVQHSADVKVEPSTPLTAEHLCWPGPPQPADAVPMDMPVDHTDNSDCHFTEVTPPASADLSSAQTQPPAPPSQADTPLPQQSTPASTAMLETTCSANSVDNISECCSPPAHLSCTIVGHSVGHPVSEHSLCARLASEEAHEDSDFHSDLSSLEQDPELEHDGEWTSRQKALIGRLTRCNGASSFARLTSGNNRKEAAVKFHTLLMLKKLKAVDVSQAHTWADVNVTLV